MKLEQSYALCRRIARRSSSSFYLSFRLLERPQRDAMCALYAFSRRTDDLIDDTSYLARDMNSMDRAESLKLWRSRLSDALSGDPAGDHWPALADTARRCAIPDQYFFDLLDGVEMDLEPRRYESIEELQVYCDRVATSVGLACLRIWGCDDSDALPPATSCGRAFQLTNILRDLREDAQRGRIYLPQSDLRRFAVKEEQLRSGQIDDRLHQLLDFEISRAMELYEHAGRTGDFLQGSGRRMFALMFDTYHRLLQAIQRQKSAILVKRIRLSGWQKVQLAMRHWGRGRGGAR
ncbi:MAG: phytoene/squalene synthase family protein [Pirellulaceae bacterium]|jgi:phytoene synthase|nr:phytoene/squalene synthase family protein [Pirellulaceae bacterium]MDP7019075.1 phytoene/squalene synthase family protein [Pirellulaceae bacterium]